MVSSSRGDPFGKSAPPADHNKPLPLHHTPQQRAALEERAVLFFCVSHNTHPKLISLNYLNNNNNMSSTLCRTNSTFVAPVPRAIGAPNTDLAHDHRQMHPSSLYTDENQTHFNSPGGAVKVPRPLRRGSDEWKVAQFALKKIGAEAKGQELTPAQIKRTKQSISKAAKSYNDKQLAEEKLAEETAQKDILRKQIRKDKKKERMKEVRQNKTEEKQVALHKEALELVEQCEKLDLDLLLSPSATDECVIEMCQDAILQYMKTPLTEKERKAREDGFAKQKANISADARASEIFRDAQTHHVVANQRVEGEDAELPIQKKKKKKNKHVTKNAPVPKVSYTPEVTIDWGDEPVVGAELLTKQQQREIAYKNRAAGGA